jgi:hypothetical protein
MFGIDGLPKHYVHFVAELQAREVLPKSGRN